VTLASAPDWLAMPSVLCVGGSWLVPAGPPDEAAIQRGAAQATRLAT
jgi:2-dehydro-3-deoxyphosphogluconate aldolase/(4S)-4-hydroxy-2-oxoglutarate aldolase